MTFWLGPEPYDALQDLRAEHLSEHGELLTVQQALDKLAPGRRVADEHTEGS